MASATFATDAVWDETIQLELRNVELLKNLRNTVGEYERNREAIAQRLRNFMPIGSPTSLLVSQSDPNPANRDKVQAHLTDKASLIPSPKSTSKTDFVEACFNADIGTNPKDINTKWVRGGGEGTISTSLVYKIKGDMVRRTGKPSRGKRVAAASRRAQESENLAEVDSDTATATAEPQPDIRQVVWDLLSKSPLTIGELITAIQDEDLIDPLPKNLQELVKETVNNLRSSGKVFRGGQCRYEVFKGVTLD